jgi:hypothetical protein
MPMLPDKNGQAPVSPSQNVPVSFPDGIAQHRVVPLDTPLSLTVQFDQVDEAVKIFEDSVAELNELIRRGRKDLAMEPMANDEVSADAAAAFTAAGDVHLDALSRYRDWLLSIANSLRASVAAYRASEDGRAESFRSVKGG